jgi:hypothetical protein
MTGPAKVPISEVFRGRAEEFRANGCNYKGHETREILLRVAADYDRMAKQAALFELREFYRDAGIVSQPGDEKFVPSDDRRGPRRR